MAITETIDSRLQLLFEVGLNEQTGDPVTRTKSFNNISIEATSEQLLNVAQTLASLQKHPLHMVRRNDTAILSEG
ncbi:DUF1659 domain-containing protein [Amphibacillus sediminis]|uniref:DUF1659 domain-containing protein n=1 Tax=Amphibacillus sediminis TaxID=360185 RepID=UPI0008304C95|nr:DUF1659 domain-containing protein [Amphibacillus sediminis]